MDELNTLSIDQMKEELLGCGSFSWNVEKESDIQWSMQMYKLFGIDQVIPITVELLKSLIIEEDYSETYDSFIYYTQKQQPQIDLIHRIQTKDGRVKKVNQRLRCSYDDNGNLKSIIGVCIDQSFNNIRDYSTRLNNEKFYRLFGDAPIGISLLRIDGTCFLCNESFVESVFYKEFELKDLPFHTLIDDEDQHGFMNLYYSIVENQIPSFRNEFRIVNKNNEKVWHDITVSSVKDIYDNIKYLIVMTQPCQRNKKTTPRKGLINTIREELNDLSLRDTLSGLYNRQYVLSKLKELILVFYEKNISFSALLIDVDHIKKVNETYGHSCGDKVIHDLSEIFKSVTRDTDISSRWGGEEFVILFPEMDIETATTLAERMRNEVKNTIMMWEGKEIQVTVSISVTSYTSDDTLKTFISKLDRALYDEKNETRDSVRVI